LLPNDPTQIKSIFTQIVAPIADVEENMFAFNMHRGITRLGYKADLEFNNDSFSHILLRAADHYYIEISAIVDEDGITLPLMVYEEFDEKLAPLMQKALGVTGRYRYQADFAVHFDDFDAQRMHDLGLSEEELCGHAFIGVVEYSAYSFQEFIQGALYKIQRTYDLEIYPTMRTPARKAF
jgi:hypothetical protein